MPPTSIYLQFSRFAGECKKAGKILASFVDPRQAFGPDKIIPPHILANAKVQRQQLYQSNRLLIAYRVLR
jgi:lipid-binding SYLF domain-containing protein